jgi:hypothetical protein
MRHKKLIAIGLAVLALTACQKESNQGSFDSDLSRSEAEAKALERIQQDEDALKSALFREGGAWTQESSLGNYTDCTKFLQETDKTVALGRFQPDHYIFDLRVGANAPEWNDPITRSTMEELNSTHANLEAEIAINPDSANVDIHRPDGNIIRMTYKYEKETDTLIQVDWICLKCTGFDITKSYAYIKFKERGSERNKFCKGSY